MDESVDLTGTIEELRPSLRAALGGIAEDLREELLARLPSVLDVVSEAAPADSRGLYRGVLRRDRRYAVRGREVDWIAQAGGIASSLHGLASVPLSVSAACAVAILVYRFRRESVLLSAEEGLVIQVLRDAPPEGWSLNELEVKLPLAFLPKGKLAGLLEGLRSRPRGDGEPVELVEKSSERYIARV